MDLQCRTPFRQPFAAGPPDSLGCPLLPNTLSPRDDLVFPPCWCLRDISAALPKGWAPQESLGGALFIHVHLRGPTGGIRHPTPPLDPPAVTSSGRARLGAHLPSEARLNSETSSSVLV